MSRRTLLFLFIGTISFLFSCTSALADFRVQCLQDHRDLRLTSVNDSPFIQTDLMLVAANDAESTEYGSESWVTGEGEDEENDKLFAEESLKPIPDPIEVVNRPVFRFNDKLYFWVLKPVSRGYGWVMPKPARKSVSKFFYNVRAPIRLVNCLLQGKGSAALHEFYRFGINTTIGIAGFFDPATSHFHIKKHDEDFGQTLGRHMGPGFFLTVPLMGPSSARDGVGTIVDSFIVPTWYVLTNYATWYWVAKAFESVNDTSLRIGQYEDLVESAIDPYVAVRDAYYQHREALIRR